MKRKLNVAAEFRRLIPENPGDNFERLFERLILEHPSKKFNRASCYQAFLASRKKIAAAASNGDSRRISTDGNGAAAQPARQSGEITLAVIRSARAFCVLAGGAASAHAIIDEIEGQSVIL